MFDADQGAYVRYAERLPTVRPLLRTDVCPTEALPKAWGVLTGSTAVIERCAGDGMGPKQLFLPVANAPEGDLSAVHGRCCYLLERMADVPRLDALVEPLLPEGRLEEVALRLAPDGEGLFTEDSLPIFARLLRRSAHLAVRGAFLTLNGGDDLSEQARAAFSLVKKLRADLPCVLHAFCLEGVLEPLLSGDEALARTLELLAALNDTSLYARFFIA